MGREAERGAGGQPAAGRESRWEPRWKRYPAAERWLADRLGELAEESPPLRRLERELAERTGSRLADWVDHLVLEDGEEPRAALRKNGFRPEEAGGAAGAGDAADGAAGPDGRLFHHPGALFPRVALRATGGAAAGTTLAAALGVEQATRFLMVQGIAAPVEGSPLASCRRAQVWRSAAAAGKAARELWVVERRGAWSLLPQEEPPGAARRYLEASERWATRQRVFADPREGLERTLERARELAGELGQPRAAWVIFEAERAYWQGRSRAGRIQKARQDSAGMGWANHDHHTFRSSRQTFGTLIRLLEALGFQPRERFYAGEQAGWGAQILEHPGCGLTVFADVDLSPQEVGVDFAHQPLEPREKLGTVGLWCALHGESILEAGLHHLAARLDFRGARAGLQREGVRMMAPFSNFPYLRQAFTRGEVWAVEGRRLRELLGSGRIAAEQGEKFAREGAIGSHLEDIQRAAGFKGFNPRSVSDIILRTDPRLAGSARPRAQPRGGERGA